MRAGRDRGARRGPHYLVRKGSVTVDGISLTVVDVFKDAFSLVIIPHTASLTTIGFKKIGDTVNLEPDMLAKYVEKFSPERCACGRSSRKSAEDPFLAKLKNAGLA